MMALYFIMLYMDHGFLDSLHDEVTGFRPLLFDKDLINALSCSEKFCLLG